MDLRLGSGNGEEIFVAFMAFARTSELAADRFCVAATPKGSSYLNSRLLGYIIYG